MNARKKRNGNGRFTVVLTFPPSAVPESHCSTGDLACKVAATLVSSQCSTALAICRVNAIVLLQHTRATELRVSVDSRFLRCVSSARSVRRFTYVNAYIRRHVAAEQLVERDVDITEHESTAQIETAIQAAPPSECDGIVSNDDEWGQGRQWLLGLDSQAALVQKELLLAGVAMLGAEGVLARVFSRASAAFRLGLFQDCGLAGELLHKQSGQLLAAGDWLNCGGGYCGSGSAQPFVG